MINNFDDSEVKFARAHIQENSTHIKSQTFNGKCIVHTEQHKLR